MARGAVHEPRSVEAWGPVRRGFAVWLADGRRGSVADIRVESSGAVKLLVATGLFFRTIVMVGAAEIDAILPGERRIIVGQPHDDSEWPRPNANAEREPVSLPVEGATSTDSPLEAA